MLSEYLDDDDLESNRDVNKDWNAASVSALRTLSEKTDYCLGCETGLDDDDAHRNPYTGKYWPECCVDPDGDC